MTLTRTPGPNRPTTRGPDPAGGANRREKYPTLRKREERLSGGICAVEYVQEDMS